MEAKPASGFVDEHLVYPLSRALYDRIVLSGALDAVPVELLYGRLVTMRPEGRSTATSSTSWAIS